MDSNIVQTITLAAFPILLAITLHEAAHGYAAKHFGDLTAYQQGRITLNPLKHIDLVGTIVLPLLTLMIGGILFGWAKPVPVNFANLKNPKRDMMWVALAGPASNLLMAIAWGFAYKFAMLNPDSYYAVPLAGMAIYGIKINLILMILNMLPLPPLDGGRVAVSLLPHRQAYALSKVEPYGMIILIVMAVTPVLGWILSPLVAVSGGLLGSVLGI